LALISAANGKTENCRIQLGLLVVLQIAYLSRTEAKVMMMMQHTNGVVNTDKVQTVKLTLYQYKFWLHVLQGGPK